MTEEKRHNVFVTFATSGIVLDPRMGNERHIKLEGSPTLEEFEEKIDELCGELKASGMKPTGEMDIHYARLNDKDVYGEVLVMCVV